MTYKVYIQTGSRKPTKRNPYGNFSSSGSTPLSNKAKVRAWIKRNGTGNVNTKVRITNNRSKKTVVMTKGVGAFYGRNLSNEIKRRMKK